MIFPRPAKLRPCNAVGYIPAAVGGWCQISRRSNQIISRRFHRGEELPEADQGDRTLVPHCIGSDGVVVGMPDEGWPRKIVTHHSSPPPAVDDLLAVGATAMPRDDASPGNLRIHVKSCH